MQTYTSILKQLIRNNSPKKEKNVEEILYIFLLFLLGLVNTILGKLHLRSYFKQ